MQVIKPILSFVIYFATLSSSYVAFAETRTAVFAGGCFWCMEKVFEDMDGVKSVEAGYSGGKEENPSYQQVSQGRTGHLEVVQITYDATKLTYLELLRVFWQQIDPTDGGGQFVDRGPQYRSAIFYQNETEKNWAENYRQALDQLKIFPAPIRTEILPSSPFYPAEDYHQDYYKKNPVRYWYYRRGSGRDAFLQKTWTTTNKQKFLQDFERLRTMSDKPATASP